MAESIHERLGGATNVLLCTPGLGGDGRGVCTELLQSRAPAETAVLWVSYMRSAADCVADWGDRTDGSTDRKAVVVPGERRGGEQPDGVHVETVGSPTDLTGLGIAIRRYLEAWDGPIVVCFDSLTSLLQCTDLETAYEFLHVLTGQLYAAGATAHFHLDPDAHDDRTVTVLRTLVDAAVTVRDDEVEVTTRRLSD
jgi:hypothetical protein